MKAKINHHDTKAPRKCWWLLLLLAGILGAQSATQPIFDKEAAPRPNEICVGCNKPIGPGDKVYLVEGRRVPVHRNNCDEAVRAAPMRFLALAKPRGGWFGGETAPHGTVSDAWLPAGLYVMLGLCFAAICAHRALNQGHSPYRWFFVGLVLNAAGYLILLTRPPGRKTRVAAGAPAGALKVPVTFSPRACPQCGTTNHPAAEHCLGCGAALLPTVTSEVSRLGMRRN